MIKIEEWAVSACRSEPDIETMKEMILAGDMSKA
jgi:hypothetical protein